MEVKNIYFISLWYARAKLIIGFESLGLGCNAAIMTVPLNWLSPFLSVNFYCHSNFPS